MSQREWRYLLIPLVVAAVLYLPAIGQRTLYHPDEARFALFARGMVEDGHWLVPHLGDEVHMEKAPLFVWAIALLSLLGGKVTELTATLPAALSGIGGVAGTFALGRRLFGARAGLLASLILATSPGYFYHARIVFADMTVALFIVWSAWAFWGAMESPRSPGRGLALFYLFVGLAFSAKGPAGLLPILPFGAFVLAEQGWRGVRTLRPLMGLGILALVSAPWAAAFVLHRGETSYVQSVLFRDYLWWYFGQWESVWELFFFIDPLVTMLPWSLLLPLAVREGYRRAGDGETRRKFRFLLFWGLAYVLVLTLMANKRLRYFMPMYPVVALMVGWLWDQWAEGRLRLRPRLYSWISGGLAAGVALVLLLPLRLNRYAAVFFPSTLDQKLFLVGLLVVGGVLGMMAFRAERAFTAFSVICLALGLVLFYETRIFIPQYNQTYDLKGFARKVRLRVGPEDRLFAFQLSRKLPYEFYLKRTLSDIQDPKELNDHLSGSHPAYFLAEEREWRKLQQATGKTWPVVEQANFGGRVVFLGTGPSAPPASDRTQNRGADFSGGRRDGG